MYKLFTDKQENFECKIEVEGASLNNASARLVVESTDLNLLFEGEIDTKGNCTIPIKKLKGLLKENSSGNLKLEVIADDVYFNPWESDFIVDSSKKIKVEIKEQTTTKPKAKITEVNKGKTDTKSPLTTLVEVLKKNEITTATIFENKKEMLPLLKEYANKLGYKNNIKKFIKEVIYKLSK